MDQLAFPHRFIVAHCWSLRDSSSRSSPVVCKLRRLLRSSRSRYSSLFQRIDRAVNLRKGEKWPT
eukprot:1987549-Heterocapsa_arctica.AAC.1